MRVDCEHYESRTYPSGDVVRSCDLDLAPDAPWRCPVDCPAFRARAVEPRERSGDSPTPDPGQGAARLLEEAEDIVKAALPSAMEEIERERCRRPWWRRFGRRHEGPG